MMKTRLPVSSYRRQPSSPWWGIVAIVTALAVVIWFGDVVFRPLGALLGVAAVPASQVGETLSGAARTLTSSRRQLVRENDELRARLLKLETLLAVTQGLSRDNEALRRELGLVTNDDGRAVVARVLPDLWTLPFGLFRVAVGEGRAVRPGAAVRAGAVLLGEVVEQTGPIVKVRLVSAPGRATPVRLGASAVPALAVGQGDGALAVSLPRGLEIPTGEWAYDASSTKPLAVGVVSAVERDESASFQTVYLGLPFNLNYLDYVEIYP